MHIRTLVMMAVLATSLLGQMCMMPMARTTEPMHMEMGEHAEMFMTPAVPMSRVMDGPVLKSVPMTSVPCTGGHCMSQGIPMATGLSAVLRYVLMVMMALGFILIAWKILEDLPFQQTLSPPFLLCTETVVLRL